MVSAEQTTAITDYALAAVSLGFAIAVGRSIEANNRVSAWLWCAAFIAAAVAGAAGGIFHNLASPSQDAPRRVLWTLIIASMGASGAFITAGSYAADVRRNHETLRWLASGIVVTLIGAIVQRLELPQSPLDHNGAYHVIQIAGLYLFYRCARTVHDRPGVPLKLRSDAREEVAQD
jgi:4-amino-4-deoxy-L-arabinose transferase-like glycosyltransferase